MTTSPALSPPTERLLQALSALNAAETLAALDAGADTAALDCALEREGGVLHWVLRSYEVEEDRQNAKEASEQVAQWQTNDRALASEGLDERLRATLSSTQEATFHIIRALLKNVPGLPLEYRRKGLTPVLQSAYLGLGQTLSHLVKHGANLSAISPMGCNAVHLAALRANIGVLRRLHGFQAPLDSTDQEGRTPAHLAAGQQHVLVLRELKRLGAHVSGENAKGRSPVAELRARDPKLADDWLAWERRHEARMKAVQLERGLGQQAAPVPPKRPRM